MLPYIFLGLTAFVWWSVRRKNARVHKSAIAIFLGLVLMVLIPEGDHTNLYDFGVWVGVAWFVRGDVGIVLILSALAYPLMQLGINSWWLQFASNTLGLLALGMIYADMDFGKLVYSRFWHNRSRSLGVVFRSSLRQSVPKEAGKIK